MKLIIICAVAIFAFGCNAAKPVVENRATEVNAVNTEKPQTAIAHSLENQTPDASKPTAGNSKWTQSGDPIDTKGFDTAIASAEMAFGKKPSDDGAKKTLGTAYFKRAVALTDARQYASALGDYRRALKYEPTNSEAKEWIDRIVSIYDSMGRTSPPEGQEPPPLPFKKGEKDEKQ